MYLEEITSWNWTNIFLGIIIFQLYFLQVIKETTVDVLQELGWKMEMVFRELEEIRKDVRDIYRNNL